MNLTLKEVEIITFGALSITESDGWFSFERFSAEQKAVYERENAEFKRRTEGCASVMLDFFTDSDTLSFDYTLESKAGPLINYAFIDVWADDMMISHVGEYMNTLTSGHAEVALPEGEIRVRVYFPNMFKTSVSNITLADGSKITPVKKKSRALILGDSITHGYEAHFPSLSYANTIIRNFELDAVNQAIGGEVFRPSILGSTPLFDADIITVAFGTNDWASGDVDFSVCKRYFDSLRTLYPSARIFYISPIWRAGAESSEQKLPFFETVKGFERVANDCGLTVIHGLDLLHHIPEMYTDGLHPNDLGFTQYANSLTKKLGEFGI